MDNKKLSFPFLIIAIIIGVALYKQFDFKTLEFEKPALAIVYMIGLGIALYVLIRDFRKTPGK